MKLTFKSAVKTLILCALFVGGDYLFHFSQIPSFKIYDAISTFYQRTSPPPAAIRDIVFVGIDSKTIAQLKEKWPYSRATFAKVIGHLKEAKPLAIGLDFSFFGNSTPEEDRELINAITEGKKVILGAPLTENAGLELAAISGLFPGPISGIVSKLQDRDGITRAALTYLVNTNSKPAPTHFFSWEMKLLETSGAVSLHALKDQGHTLILDGQGNRWRIPVDPTTKTFLIRFRAHSKDFERYSFSDILENQFDPKEIENKIVLIGFLTELLQDVHQTPIGWLPGLTLNANALLTLYAKDFLKTVHPALTNLLVILGIAAGSVLASYKKVPRPALWVLGGIGLFFIASYLLFYFGYIWNYVLFPIGITAAYLLNRPAVNTSGWNTSVDK